MKYSVETNALAIGYGKAALARDIALGAAKGQVLALIGPNGAANPPCSKHWRGSWPLWAARYCWTGRSLPASPATPGRKSWR